MPKQYKAQCEIHENEELTSFPGEDLDRFRKRMEKKGHKVGELTNAEMQLTDRGKVIWAEMQGLIEKLVKGQEELAKEIVEVKGTRPPFSPGLSNIQPAKKPPADEPAPPPVGADDPEPPGA
jgi:hypothetical protein